MKISKQRLLQIIREEIELHEKNIIEIDEASLKELTDDEEKQAINREVTADKKAGKIKESDVEEDQLIKRGTKNKVVPVKKQNDI